MVAVLAGAPTTLWNVTSVGDLGVAGLINPSNFVEAVKNLGTEVKTEMSTGLQQQLSILKNGMETITAVVSPSNNMSVALPDPAQVGDCLKTGSTKCCYKMMPPDLVSAASCWLRLSGYMCCLFCGCAAVSTIDMNMHAIAKV
jgi:hypothetical protein